MKFNAALVLLPLLSLTSPALASKASKALDAFIDSIPASKLDGLPTTGGTIHKDVDFRVDMQGMTSDKPPKHNLQVQVNRGTTIPALQRFGKSSAPTVSIALVPSEDPWSAAEIIAELKKNKHQQL